MDDRLVGRKVEEGLANMLGKLGEVGGGITKIGGAMLDNISENAASVVQEIIVVNRRSVKMIKKIAEGGFGFIYLVEDAYTGEQLVLKHMILQDESQKKIFQKEVRLMTSLNHEGLLTAMDYSLEFNQGRILMEYCPGGHLLQRMQDMGSERFRTDVILHFFLQITSAVNYLHSQTPPIAHWDLKLENVLITNRNNLKLCDFGSSIIGPYSLETQRERASAEILIERTTTQCYRSPEQADLFIARQLDGKVDVWALGCILYTLMFFKQPFQNESNLAIINGRYRIPPENTYPEDLIELLRRILNTDPVARPDSSQVLAWTRQLAEGQRLAPIKTEPSKKTGKHKGSEKPTAQGSSQKQSTTPPPTSSNPKALNPNSAAARRLLQRASSWTEKPAPAAPQTDLFADTPSSDWGFGSSQEPVIATEDLFALLDGQNKSSANDDPFGLLGSFAPSPTAAPVQTPFETSQPAFAPAPAAMFDPFSSAPTAPLAANTNTMPPMGSQLHSFSAPVSQAGPPLFQTTNRQMSGGLGMFQTAPPMQSPPSSIFNTAPLPTGSFLGDQFSGLSLNPTAPFAGTGRILPMQQQPIGFPSGADAISAMNDLVSPVNQARTRHASYGSYPAPQRGTMNGGTIGQPVFQPMNMMAPQPTGGAMNFPSQWPSTANPPNKQPSQPGTGPSTLW